VLKKLKSDKPRFFVVWTSVYGADNRELAVEGAKILSDPRVKNYYEAKPEAVMAFGKLVDLPRDAPLAYDVYFLYDGKAEWKAAPPKPTDWWHQIIDDARFLDGKKLKLRLEELLRSEK
jgi:hypothetical protein